MNEGKHLQRIMYVDDEPDIAEIVKLSLERIGGYEVVICENGKVALEKIENYTPDMVLLDVMMPEMDGPTTLGELKKRGYIDNIPVVFVTAKVQPYEIDHFREIGAADVIAKPFDPLTLSNQIEAIWSAMG